MALDASFAYRGEQLPTEGEAIIVFKLGHGQARHEVAAVVTRVQRHAAFPITATELDKS